MSIMVKVSGMSQGRRGGLDGLMTKTREGTQGFSRKPTPVSPLAGGLYGEDRLRGLARISAFLSDVDHRSCLPCHIRCTLPVECSSK